jgi:hypothetical protein
MKYGFGREARLQLQFGPICNIGGSSSDTKTSTTTNNIDQRLNADNGALGLSVSGGNTGNVNIVQTDHGAISDAFGLGHDALSLALQTGTGALSATSQTAQAAINGMLTSSANSLNVNDDITTKALGFAGTQAANAENSMNDTFTKALNFASTQTANSINSVQDMAGRLDTMFTQNSQALATAYQDAKTGDQLTLMKGAFAIAAVALFAMAYRKA